VPVLAFNKRRPGRPIKPYLQNAPPPAAAAALRPVLRIQDAARSTDEAAWTVDLPVAAPQAQRAAP
jgi:hypothetical protein